MPENIPEWDIFERLEKLEELKPTTKDTAILATFAFTLAFHAVASGTSNPRELKDTWLWFMRKRGLSTESQRVLEEWLLTICKLIEER